MRRRAFIRETAIGMAVIAGTGMSGLRAEGLDAGEAAASERPEGRNTELKMGRPVRVVSIGFKGSTPLSEVEKQVDREGSRGSDIILLPELCRGQDKASEEPLQGATVSAMAALAKKHKTYIAVPIDREDGNRRLNSVALLDRSGQVAYVYNKVFPYWSEYDVNPSVVPGEAVGTYQADFGRVGIATCYDVNFPEVWRRLSDEGAELVLWPSEYSGGSSLQAHAINHHYYVVSCSQSPDCVVYDINGERILYEHALDANISRVTLDLDRAIYHENFNIDKRDQLMKEHADDVEMERWMRLEQWFILKAKRPGVSARDLAQQYGLEELRHYLDRSRVAIDKLRGWTLAESVIFPDKSVDELKASAQKRA